MPSRPVSFRLVSSRLGYDGSRPREERPGPGSRERWNTGEKRGIRERAGREDGEKEGGGRELLRALRVCVRADSREEEESKTERETGKEQGEGDAIARRDLGSERRAGSPLSIYLPIHLYRSLTLSFSLCVSLELAWNR